MSERPVTAVVIAGPEAVAPVAGLAGLASLGRLSRTDPSMLLRT